MENQRNSENYGGEAGCTVLEEQFPLLQKCCAYSRAGILLEYQSACPHCNVLILPPDGWTLKITLMIECRRNGYRRRVKENDEL